MKEIYEFEFEFAVNGEARIVKALGGTQFEAERMAIIQLMRNEGFEYDDIVFKKKISEKPTGEWI